MSGEMAGIFVVCLLLFIGGVIGLFAGTNYGHYQARERACASFCAPGQVWRTVGTECACPDKKIDFAGSHGK